MGLKPESARGMKLFSLWVGNNHSSFLVPVVVLKMAINYPNRIVGNYTEIFFIISRNPIGNNSCRFSVLRVVDDIYERP